MRAYTPQQNGIAKQRNRTLLDMVRSMLKSRNVSSEFWEDEVVTAAYIRNRLTCKHRTSMWHEYATTVMRCMSYRTTIW